MQPTPTIKFTEHMGRRLGRTWAGVAYRETRVTHWLAAYGIPVGVAKVLLWVGKLVLLGVLLYVVFWLALLLLFVVAAALAVEHRIPNEEEDDWPFKSQEELRKTPGYDPVLYNDIAHSDYPDERDG